MSREEAIDQFLNQLRADLAKRDWQARTVAEQETLHTAGGAVMQEVRKIAVTIEIDPRVKS